MPHIIPIRDLKDTGAVSQMCKQSREPIFITKNGYGDMVLMSMKVYEEQLLLTEVYEKLAAAENDIATENVLDADTSLRALRGQLDV